MIYVFLKNKIIGADAAAPLMMEFKARFPERPVKFIVPSLKALHDIERNHVLHEALTLSGELAQVGRRFEGLLGWVESKIRGALWVAAIYVRATFGRVSFVHFGALEQWPFNILFAAARSRTLLVDSAFHGFSKGQRAVASLKPDREAERLPQHMSAALAFHDDSIAIEAARRVGVPCFRMEEPHNLPAWRNWIDENADKYLAADRLARPMITFILGFFGPLAFLKDKRGCVEVFEESLDIITATLPGFTVALKPHVITDMDQLQRSLAKFVKGKFVVTNLHPEILALRSHAVLSNYYSTAQSSAHALGVPTIEYTEYSDEALRVTWGGPIRPEHTSYFIQRDRARLEDLLIELTKGEPRRARRGPETVDDRVFSFLN